MAKHLEAASVLPACPASLAGSPLKNRLLTPSKQSSKLNFLCIPRLPEADNIVRLCWSDDKRLVLQLVAAALVQASNSALTAELQRYLLQLQRTSVA